MQLTIRVCRLILLNRQVNGTQYRVTAEARDRRRIFEHEYFGCGSGVGALKQRQSPPAQSKTE